MIGYVRRWFRFRTRTLLAAIGLVWVVLGYQANQARERQRAIDYLVGIGGQVLTSPAGPAWARSIVPTAWVEEAWLVSFNDKYPAGRRLLMEHEDWCFAPTELESYFFFVAYPVKPGPPSARPSLSRATLASPQSTRC